MPAIECYLTVAKFGCGYGHAYEVNCLGLWDNGTAHGTSLALVAHLDA